MRVSPAMAARVMAPKPAWRVVAQYPGLNLRTTVPAGVARTADEAVAWWRTYRKRSTPLAVWAERL